MTVDGGDAPLPCHRSIVVLTPPEQPMLRPHGGGLAAAGRAGRAGDTCEPAGVMDDELIAKFQVELRRPSRAPPLQRDRRRTTALPAPTPPTAGGSEELEQHNMISSIEATKYGKQAIDSFPV